jgi:gamma-glutamyltranspeptidase/glutathione hydrolase
MWFDGRPYLRSASVLGLISGLVTLCVVAMLPFSWLDTLTCLLALGISDVGASVIKHEYSYETGSSATEISHTKDSDYDSASSYHGLHGAVASESTICSGIGRDLLLKGGNAADAMVGTVFCVGVIGMYHSGVGGGGFMLVRGSDGEYEFIDFRETAPAAAFQDMYKNNTGASIHGGLARYAQDIRLVF